jgi:predicted GH43/DUF377 family glycosyl hydrolase
VLASLRRQLLTPGADERYGYVPNVVKTCGAVLDDDLLNYPDGIGVGAIGIA